jgi:hypothetical protein
VLLTMAAARQAAVSIWDAANIILACHPCRKVAVPVPDNYSWEQFIDKVRQPSPASLRAHLLAH